MYNYAKLSMPEVGKPGDRKDRKTGELHTVRGNPVINNKYRHR